VHPDKEQAFQKAMADFPAGRIGEFQATPEFRMTGLNGRTVVNATIGALQESWEAPFKGW